MSELRMQNAECRMQNGEPQTRSAAKHPYDLGERLVEFSVRIIRLSSALPKTEEGLHIRRQLLHSGTSAGANYFEARGAESLSDFLHKLQIALKELRETKYWLDVVASAELLPPSKLADIVLESDELIAIVVRSLVTARRNARHAKQ